jgi:ADP-ribose pyrophosphatase YjhB (NUDIX family)
VRSGLLTGYQAAGEAEAADVARMTRLAATVADPWSRSQPLHFTGSALVMHPESRRVLLRWHTRHGRWLQVGGHGDPGESDPLQIALREAREETGLADLVPWPDPALRHAVVCHVPASAAEPEHEHADLRFFLATASPDDRSTRPGNSSAATTCATRSTAPTRCSPAHSSDPVCQGILTTSRTKFEQLGGRLPI